MSRLLVLDQEALTLWRRGHPVRSWSVSDVVAGCHLALPGDGLSLLVLSGAVHADPVRIPDLGGVDRRRYLRQLFAQHTANTCGAWVTVGELTALQRIDGAVGLDALLLTLADRGVRLRRVRHVAQLAEVVCRCMAVTSRQCLVGWMSDQGMHLCAVRASVVLWHRVVMRDREREHAFDETEQHAREHGLFAGGVDADRVWLGRAESSPVPGLSVVCLGALMRALWWKEAVVGVLDTPSTLSTVLASATSDLKTASPVSAWRRRAALQGIASVAGLCCIVSLAVLWRVESVLAQHDLDAMRSPLVEYASSQLVHSEQLVSRTVVADITSADGAQDARAWRRAVHAVAAVMSDHSALTLARLTWWAGDSNRLQLVVTAPIGPERAETVAAIAAAFSRLRWTLKSVEPSEPQSTALTDRHTLELVFAEVPNATP